MPIIKPRPDGQKTLVKVRVNLTKENDETLREYARFIDEPGDFDYVLNQLIETVLAKDKDFIAFQRKLAQNLEMVLADAARGSTPPNVFSSSGASHPPMQPHGITKVG